MAFDPSRIPPPLARALLARGISSLTPVQRSVIHAEPRSADMLVSAATGTGKTVAFGLAMAHRLLPEERVAAAPGAPRALVLVPTRELAMQVRDTLGWLYKETGLRIGSCIGGAPPGTERAALRRGLDAVVATPGRLKHHLDQGSIATDGIVGVVLDEADVMFDLGFRDTLAAILEALPAARQTLMVTATVTPQLNAFAAKHLRAALRLDLEAGGTEPPKIAYQAVHVASGDLEAAIVNLLRLHEAARAVVFCGRRERAGLLAHRLAARGFSAVALSGALEFPERLSALAAIREGRARVCVATDLAARGLDLPNLELVIHADLPFTREILLHRSGRTGRAGRSGLAILVVPDDQRERAEALLGEAGVSAAWVDPPRPEDVATRDHARVLADPALLAAAASTDLDAIAKLVATHSPEQLALAYWRCWGQGRPVPQRLTQLRAERVQKRRWFRLTVGHTRRAKPRWILPLICRLARVERSEIGRIVILEDVSRFEVIGEKAQRQVAAAIASPPPARPGEEGIAIRHLDRMPRRSRKA